LQHWSARLRLWRANRVFRTHSRVLSHFLRFRQHGDRQFQPSGQRSSTFQVAGSNGRYSSGTATIVGNTIQVTGVTSPKHVRYGISGVGNLFNSVNIPTEGGTKSVTQLPASLFQLDFP
jgi:hypothetical protein